MCNVQCRAYLELVVAEVTGDEDEGSRKGLPIGLPARQPHRVLSEVPAVGSHEGGRAGLIKNDLRREIIRQRQ